MLDPVPDEPERVRLTRYSSGGGCASKLSPAELRSVLGLVRGFDTGFHPDLLVGLDTSDDAAVYRISDEQALVVSADFFTPIVDDPYEWGRVAAANALSDVYAMGGQPLLAINLVSWPREGLSLDLLARVLDGGADMVRAAGAVVAGGHSIDDTSPKYGMAVVGLVHPRRVLTNSGARPGDALLLTKPLGLGVVAAALAQDDAPVDAATEALRLMTTLNDGARDAALEIGVSAATDVTGFGLLGHLREMLVASGLAARLELNRVPFIPGVRDLAGSGYVPGGTHRNHAFVSPTTDWGTVSSVDQLILADAQTSGGLLLAVEPSRAGALVAALNQRATPAAAVIGHTVEGAPGHIGIR